MRWSFHMHDSRYQTDGLKRDWEVNKRTLLLLKQYTKQCRINEVGSPQNELFTNEMQPCYKLKLKELKPVITAPVFEDETRENYVNRCLTCLADKYLPELQLVKIMGVLFLLYKYWLLKIKYIKNWERDSEWQNLWSTK